MFMRGMGGKGHVCACSMEKCNFGQAESKASPRLQPKADGKVGVSLICRELQTATKAKLALNPREAHHLSEKSGLTATKDNKMKSGFNAAINFQ